MRILPYGENAVLIELPTLKEVMTLYAALRATPLEGVLDLIPAARTVLVIMSRASDRSRVIAQLRATQPQPAIHTENQSVDIPVVYDGEDLHDVAQTAGMSPTEVIRRHSSTDYVVAFCGFTPGFAYLHGLDPALHVPRRNSPRTSVRAGSVAIASEYSAVYPRSSPGGWNILGRTSMKLFDLDRDPPSLLEPATVVRFRLQPR